jgi:hypothetical protein
MVAYRDIPCRVHVSVRPEPTSHTHKDRLTRATLRTHMLADVTGHRRAHATFTLSTLPGTPAPRQATSMPHPNVRMPRFSPAFSATPTLPHQRLLQTKVPHIPAMAALLDASTFCTAPGYKPNPIDPNVTSATEPRTKTTPQHDDVAATPGTLTPTGYLSPRITVLRPKRCANGAPRTRLRGL